MFNIPYPALWNEVCNSGKRIRKRNIDSNEFVKPEFTGIIIRNKTDLPHFKALHAYQHSLLKFSFVTGKCFEKIFDRRVDIFNPWCMLQPSVEQTEDPAGDKVGAQISN